MKSLSIKTKLLAVVFLIVSLVTILLTIQSVTTIKNMTNKSIQRYAKQIVDEKKLFLKHYVDMAKGVLKT